MSLLKVNEIQVFNGTTVTITATNTETSADLNVGADLDVTGTLTLGTALAVAEGGTGATTASGARTTLGLAIGVDVQAYDADTTKNDVSNTFTANQIISVSDNTNAALRITQTGTGNALVVEDETNPDSTPVVVDDIGRVMLGTLSTRFVGVTTPELLIEGEFGGRSSIGLVRNQDNADGPYLTIAKTRGTNGTSTVVLSDDELGQIVFSGGDGTDIASQAASIAAFVDGTPGTGDMPGRLVFSTTADGAEIPTERMRIDSSGNVGIGTSSPSQKLDVSGNINATGALTLGTALAIAEGGTGATDAATARTNLDVDQAGTDNSTDCTLVTTSHDYLSIAGQAITLGPIDLAADVTGSLPYASVSGTPTLGTAAAEDVGYFATAAQGTLADSAVQPGDDANTLGSGAATDGYVLTADGAGGAAWEAASGGGGGVSDGDKGDITVSSSGTVWTIDNAVVTNAKLSLSANDSNIKTALNASGSAPIYACRAWVNFRGTSQSGTATASGLVNGQYTATVTSASQFTVVYSGTTYTINTSGNHEIGDGEGVDLTVSGTTVTIDTQIRASGNVSSITDNSSGNYTVNFTTAMPDANYSVFINAVATLSGRTASASPYYSGTYSTSAVQIFVKDSADITIDSSIVNVSVFR